MATPKTPHDMLTGMTAVSAHITERLVEEHKYSTTKAFSAVTRATIDGAEFYPDVVK